MSVNSLTNSIIQDNNRILNNDLHRAVYGQFNVVDRPCWEGKNANEFIAQVEVLPQKAKNTFIKSIKSSIDFLDNHYLPKNKELMPNDMISENMSFAGLMAIRQRLCSFIERLK